MIPKRLLLTTLTTLLSINCGSSGGDGDGDGDGDPCESSERYMELAEGKVWTFAVTNVAMGTTQTKTQTIGALEDVGDMKAGIQAFRVTTIKTSGMVTSWQEDTGSSIRRHRERDEAGGTQVDEFYDAYKLRVDEAAERIAVGAEFTEAYSESSPTSRPTRPLRPQ